MAPRLHIAVKADARESLENRPRNYNTEQYFVVCERVRSAANPIRRHRKNTGWGFRQQHSKNTSAATADTPIDFLSRTLEAFWQMPPKQTCDPPKQPRHRLGETR